MTISTLTDLKKNPIFSALNYAQSSCDTGANHQVTRSPLHAISFLIAYAGLDTESRNQVVTQLEIVNITTRKMDALVNDIDWVAILSASSTTVNEEQQAPSTDLDTDLDILRSLYKDSPASDLFRAIGERIGREIDGDFPIGTGEMRLQFTIVVANKDTLLSSLKERCSRLYEAIITIKDAVIFKEQTKITFLTTVSQTEYWRKEFSVEFSDDDQKEYWQVPHFNLSPSLLKIIERLEQNTNITVGGFEIKKGVGARAKEIQLEILASVEHKFSIKNKHIVNPGIYNAFIGIKNFYGLDSVAM